MSNHHRGFTDVIVAKSVSGGHCIGAQFPSLCQQKPADSKKLARQYCADFVSAVTLILSNAVTLGLQPLQHRRIPVILPRVDKMPKRVLQNSGFALSLAIALRMI